MDSGTDPAATESGQGLIQGRALALQVVLGLFLLGAAVAGLGLLYREPLETLAQGLVERWGLGFVFFGVLVIDTCPFPLINEPILALGVAGGLSPLGVGTAAALASLAAAALGYLCGYGLRALGVTDSLLGERVGPISRYVSKYGFWGIALAALTPLPFALCAWTAGALRMRLLPFVLGALFRVPKVGFYLWIIQETWRLSGS